MSTQQQIAIDNLNYHNDPRTGDQPEQGETIMLEDKDGDIEELKVPTVWVVCGLCDGEGKHVNPSIDAGGLTAEDFADDPDFMEDYMGGAFDVACNRCKGRTTVKEPDLSGLSDDQLAAYNRYQDDLAADEAMHRAELAMGA